MKNQIALLGGQLSPVYWGIKEYESKFIHVLYTKESKKHLTKLKQVTNSIKLFTYQVDPNNFLSTLDVVQNILGKYGCVDFILNLTGGTKVMALACQNACQEFGVKYFYIDQKHFLFEMPNLEKRKMSSKADLKTVLKISGSKSNRYSNPKQVYNSSDYELSNFIHINLNKRSVRKLQTTLIRQYQASMKVSSAKVDGADINITDQITYSIGDEESHFNATKASELILGRGLWWEILISYHLDKNKENYSHFMNVEFISETNNILNEIDILLFDSRTLHFIEAKSGSVKQSDINKIVAVRNLYGSVLSHSFLISRYKPRPDILEKCKNLGIHVIVYGKTSNEKTFTSIRNLNELAKIVNTKLNLRRI